MIGEFGSVDTSTLSLVETALLTISGIGLGSGIIVAVVGLFYRRRTLDALPPGAAVLVGTAPVAGWILVQWRNSGPILSDLSMMEHVVGTYILIVLCVASVMAMSGARFGDQLACHRYDIPPNYQDGDVATLVRRARRTITLEIPEQIDDIAGQPVVGDSIKQMLSGTSLSFPRGLSISALESRLKRQLQRDWGIGHVDVSCADDGTVDRLAIGRDRTDLGSSLPPGTVAVAIRTVSVPAAGPGDRVEIWDIDDDTCLVATGTLRASVGTVSTIVVDQSDRDIFSTAATYRLMTKHTPPSDAFEFLSVIESAAVSIRSKTIDAGDSLEDEFVGWVPTTVLCIKRDSDIHPFPDDNEVVQSGDELWVIGNPETIGAFDDYDPRRPEKLVS